MKIKYNILLIILLFMLSNMAPYNNSNSAILVLSDSQSETFSKFRVIEEDGILVGININTDYEIVDGIYRIKSTSKNKYQNRNIVIINQ